MIKIPRLSGLDESIDSGGNLIINGYKICE